MFFALTCALAHSTALPHPPTASFCVVLDLVSRAREYRRIGKVYLYSILPALFSVDVRADDE